MPIDEKAKQKAISEVKTHFKDFHGLVEDVAVNMANIAIEAYAESAKPPMTEAEIVQPINAAIESLIEKAARALTCQHNQDPDALVLHGDYKGQKLWSAYIPNVETVLNIMGEELGKNHSTVRVCPKVENREVPSGITESANGYGCRSHEDNDLAALPAIMPKPEQESGELEYLRAFHEIAQPLIGTVHLALKDGDLGRALARMEVYKAKLPKFKTHIEGEPPKPGTLTTGNLKVKGGEAGEVSVVDRDRIKRLIISEIQLAATTEDYSYHEGMDDLFCKLTPYLRTTEPVSLARCIEVMKSSHYSVENQAKACLDAAGVKYAE